MHDLSKHRDMEFCGEPGQESSHYFNPYPANVEYRVSS